MSPGSHCPSCGTFLRPIELVPILSWVALRGRCRTCGVSISARYPLVELGCAAAVRARRLAARLALQYRWPPDGCTTVATPETPRGHRSTSPPTTSARPSRRPSTRPDPISSSRRCSSARRSRGCVRTRPCSGPSRNRNRRPLPVAEAHRGSRAGASTSSRLLRRRPRSDEEEGGGGNRRRTLLIAAGVVARSW